MIPDYPIGGKRILISDDYYAALNRENVEVVTSGIDHLDENAVATKDGRTIPVDVLIYATGLNPLRSSRRWRFAVATDICCRTNGRMARRPTSASVSRDFRICF